MCQSEAMSNLHFPAPFARIPHPFAADYGRPQRPPHLHSTFVSRDTRQPQCSSTSSSAYIPILRYSPRPQHTPRPTPRPERPTYYTTLKQLMPIPQPLPLCSPPPPSDAIFPSDPFVSTPPSQPRSAPRLIRPDSRIRRHQKKKSMVVPDLKPLSRNDPEIKGLYPIMEEEDEWVGLSHNVLSRLRQLEGISPANSSASSVTPSPAPMSYSPIYQLSSARASSQLLAPSPIREVDAPVDVDDDGDVVMSDLGNSPQHVLTPHSEDEDPFAFDAVWGEPPSTSPELVAQSSSRRDRSHRPPPLNLAKPHKKRSSAYYSVHPFAREGRESFSIGSSPTQDITEMSPPLLSPLPIASPGVIKARRRSSSGKTTKEASPKSKKRRSKQRQPDWLPREEYSLEGGVDLESAMEELLASAGERNTDIFWLGSDESSSRSSSSTAEMSISTSESEGIMSDSELFYRRPKSSHYSNKSDRELAAAFPLPPIRAASLDYSPARPSRAEDMGIGAFVSYEQGLLASPIQISPVLETPRTPDNQLVSRFSTPSPLPTKTKERRGWMPRLSGDHSFLHAMSRGEDPPREPMSLASPVESDASGLLSPISQFSSIGSDSSGSSTSSRTHLPKRTSLPDQWKMFGRRI